ncbi:hypothetical protein HYX14_03265 [Candidatus Woesearchaeota archaeon]|nr:hypothetical protein [Candidatus Woesearchaeota archaeon]
MKKVWVCTALVMVLFVIGCVDYKAYDLPKETKEDADLVTEIADLEKQLAAEEKTANEAPVVKEEAKVKEEPKEAAPPTAAPKEEATSASTPKEEVKEIKTEVALPVMQEDTSLQTVTVKENEMIRLKVDVKDPDDDPVTYTFSKPLGQKGEWKTEYGDAGEYLVTLTATDGKLTSTKKMKIVVQRVNVPPVIEPTVDFAVQEGDVVKFTPKVRDPNKDSITITVSDPLKTGTWKTDHTSAGDYRIKVEASDGELKSAQEFKIMVKDVNVLPVMSNAKDLTVNEGQTVRLEPKVSDLDEKDRLVVTISEPVGNDGVWQTSFMDHGQYSVNVSVSDGKDTISRKVKITVLDINMPPEIMEIALS